MCEKHYETARQWKVSLELELPSEKGFVIVGDNIDKRITPRNMRIDHQVQSLHYFHSLAARNRIPTTYLDDRQQLKDVTELVLSDFLPTVADCTKIRSNFAVLVARTLVKTSRLLLQIQRGCTNPHLTSVLEVHCGEICGGKAITAI